MTTPLPGSRLGPIVGLAGGAAFVWVNRRPLPASISWAAVTIWAVLFALAAWHTWAHPKRRAGSMTPRPHAGRTYGLACLAMVVLIIVGTRALDSSGHEAAVPSLVAAVVGLHFLPFSRAFNAPFFTALGGAMAMLGTVGCVLALAIGVPWGAAFAVLAGLAMTGLVALDARRCQWRRE